ncbi:hypothetical protein J4208_01520 [Candidatus Woesearchaeota archaeon]|nr:hypothetical protein [Candidatus Woesearchaeota archaeon]
MTTVRKVIIIARHGYYTDIDGIDQLTNESVQSMYAQGLDFETTIGQDCQTGKAFVFHSNKPRTRNTARARLAGIRKMTPAPQTETDLERVQFDGVMFRPDPRMSYRGIKMNGMGTEYCEWMLANRHATQNKGVEVTSFQQIYDTRRPLLGDAVRLLENGNFGLGVISGHSPLVDIVVLSAVDSARSTPCTEYVGGQFDRENIAHLVIDINQKSGTTDARLLRNDLVLPVNLDVIKSF